MPSNKKFTWGETTTWSLVALFTLVWWGIAGRGRPERLLLVVWLSLASFIVGSIVGFLFTSYGEETNTVGKVRDWLIGGLTGLTIAKAGAIKSLLLLFSAGPGPAEFAFTVGASVFYAGVGFYFMFFQRELILNVVLAKRRAERSQLDGSQETGQVVRHFLVRLPASVLTGVDSIDEVPDLKQAETENLKELLYSDDVNSFLQQAEDAASSASLDWDTVSKTAYIYYYRTYFAADEQRKAAINKASEWLTRALNMNPMHMDLTMKYSEMVAAAGDKDSAVSILQRISQMPEAPVLVWEWIGYYLRSNPARADDAIRYCEDYHRMYPDETDSLFNLAYAYAIKYRTELKGLRAAEKLDSENRQKALDFLQTALQDQPEMKEAVQKWFQPGNDLEFLLHDNDVRNLVGLPKEAAAVA